MTPQGEISTSNIRLYKDDGSVNNSFKEQDIYINNIGLYGVINILNDRFRVVFLRRNDRISYSITEDYKYISQESTKSVYQMFIEKL